MDRRKGRRGEGEEGKGGKEQKGTGWSRSGKDREGE